DRRMSDRALGEYCDVRRSAADIDDANTELTFVVGQHRVTRRQLLEDDVLDLQPAALDALLDVLRCIHRAGDEMNFRLEAYARHPERFLDAFLSIDDVLLRQDV